ncbi:hypothetical protein [Streptomyces sp. NPDC091215]|uniref:hypothetical protein n=1 Tax=Streptomyces sp. NPDC091215 TaxID=3155192 RepID=UPI0034402773
MLAPRTPSRTSRASRTSQRLALAAVPAVSLLLLGLTTAPASAGTARGADCGPAADGASAYAQSSGTVHEDRAAFASATSDESAVLVTGGELFLRHSTVAKTGDSSSAQSSSFTGLNAGVLVNNGGAAHLDHTSVTTNGLGANGVFATGSTSVLTMTGCSVTTTGQGAHGADATHGATLSLRDVDVSTHGASSSAIATDQGGGTVDVRGGHIVGDGERTAGIYSTGDITVHGADVTSVQDKGGVIDGANSITLDHARLTGALGGFMLWNTLPFREGIDTVKVDGGAVTAESGDLFYVTNTESDITVGDGARLVHPEGALVDADKASVVRFTGEHVRLHGDITASSDSSVTATLEDGAALTGTITHAALALDPGGHWTVTGDSALTSLAGAEIHGDRITGITGNGHTVTYDASLAANSALGGLTYRLAGGGVLTPAS